MVRVLYENICNEKETRANLIALKKELKEEPHKRALAYLLAGDFSVFANLLNHEDAKVRKNAALILGELECADLMPALWEAYEREQQRFVKSAYLKGLSNYEYSAYLPKLKKRLEMLREEVPAAEHEKHEQEERTLISAMIRKYEKPGKHRFINGKKETEVILVTNRNHREVTRGQLTEEQTTLFAGGVRVLTKDIRGLLRLRTFSEMMFPVRGVGVLSENPEQAAKELSGSHLLSFLKETHEEKTPFYFRTELKCSLPLDKKSVFVKKFSQALERETHRELINTASDYEIELRLLAKKEGGYVVLLKLFTMEDTRFAYRKQAISSSLAPVNAALMMQLAKPWLTPEAQVLDPFCGVGTMLIERHAAMPARPLYGIDIFEEAIEKARENAKAAEVVINFINRDFWDFKHEYLFDEIVSNMPAVTRTKDLHQITELYERFFEKSRELLKENGIMVLYTMEEAILKNCLKKYSFIKEQQQFLINDRERSVLFVLGMK